MRLHIIRHGDPDYAHDTLTQSGRLEASALAVRLETLPIRRILTSPYGRARMTAQPLCERIGLTAETVEWAAELEALRAASWTSGEEIVVWNLPARQLRRRQATPAEDRRLWQVRNGLRPFLAEYGIRLRRSDAVCGRALPDDFDIALFCHHGAGLAVLSVLLDISVNDLWRTCWLAPSSVTTLLFEQQDQQVNFRMTCMSDTSHLFGTPLSGNCSGLIYNQS